MASETQKERRIERVRARMLFLVAAWFSLLLAALPTPTQAQQAGARLAGVLNRALPEGGVVLP